MTSTEPLELQIDDSIARPEWQMGISDWRERIVVDKSIHHGAACIRGTRVAVSVVLASLAELSIDELLCQFPQLTHDDVKAALYFASKAVHALDRP